jgi:hypothetical protein
MGDEEETADRNGERRSAALPGNPQEHLGSGAYSNGIDHDFPVVVLAVRCGYVRLSRAEIRACEARGAPYSIARGRWKIVSPDRGRRRA